MKYIKGGVNYTQEAAVFKKSATHGAEDVAVYAFGPMSYLFSRTVEQNFITHAMAYSACKKFFILYVLCNIFKSGLGITKKLV